MTKQEVLDLLDGEIAAHEAAEATLWAGTTPWEHDAAKSLTDARVALAGARSTIASFEVEE